MRTVLRSLTVTAMLAAAVAVAAVAPPSGARADLAAVESPLDAPDLASDTMAGDGQEQQARGPREDRGPKDERGPREGRGPRDDRGRPAPGDDEPAPEPVESIGPFDYIAQAQALSQPQYAIEKFATTVKAHDGEDLYVEVTLPERGDEIEEWPVILEASPYHGTLADREGIRIFPDAKDAAGRHIGMTGYFAPRGYAVVMMDLRGTGMSSGCLDHLGPDDAKDMKTVVEWAASQPWSTGEVGMTGHSYVGSTPAVAAAQDPDGLVTIAPSAGLGSMYDHQFHNGVPWFLQYAGPIFAYEQLALQRDLPGGEHAGERPEQTGCGLQHSAATAGHGQATGEWQAWHTVRDHRAGAAAWEGPIFMIHGVNDNAARIPAAEWFFGDRAPNPADKVWVGQWDHGSAGATTCREAESVGHVNCRFDQWKYALHAWFDKHLQHRDVATGPAVEAFLNGETVTTSTVWDATPGALALYPDAADGSLRLDAPAEAATATFTSVAGEGATEFASAPFDADTTFLGMPQLDLDVSTTTSAVLHVVTTLYAEDAEGARRPMNFCAANTMLRHDVRTPAPVVPGQVMDLDLQCFTAAHHVAAGERLVLSVGTSSQHHVPTHTTDLRVSVHTGPASTSAYTLPLDADAVVYPDVERFEAADSAAPVLDGPAQPGASGTVVVAAPGAGVIVEPVTAAAFEFAVEDGFDNVTMAALATPSTPADIDLYLQRRAEDGTWSGNLASGTSGDLDRESLSYSVPAGIEPGTYRILVHNWAGAPNQVEVEVTFTNAAGEPGS
ncbi:MAG: CocE/NonD family hydrolase [Actinobacteria bacterium]|jgi:predicted acyl esterase|nr:CocE/NonD family hydrolase [Actinomycetota bacterium]